MKQNHLATEKSPYLLQHADNPIDWYPWGEAAFTKAKEEDKPIFLSIGYSTCHWCHVMAHESFEDETVASYMNERYVAIKVDREERPDIDSLYMKVCQMMTGHGGWPLTIVMTPEQIPFYAGTYFPREGRHGLPGIMEVLEQLNRIYHEDKAQLKDVEASVTGALQQTIVTKGTEGLSTVVVEKAYAELKQFYDPVFGGFGTTQKFPQPQNLLFLLHYHQVSGEREPLEMVEYTLNKMVRGGIWDHVSFGFSRYTVDRRWQTPHFEKMLYDNALLLMVLATCYQITQKPVYKDTATQLITFIEQEMTDSSGAFYSAIDADSEGEEGKFYVFDFAELYQLLGEDEADEFVEEHGLSPRGNFEGKNIIQGPPIQEDIRLALLAEREKRVRPHTDDKVLTSWNSLMIAGLARAAKVFQEDRYKKLAEDALHFIETKLVKDGRLMARYRDGETKFLAYHDDYAFLAWAYLELYEATFNLSFLERAVQWTSEMEELFWDEEQGGFFFSGHDSERLLIKDKDIAEGAMPSGNAIAAFLYAKLAKLTGNTMYTDRLYELYQVFGEDVRKAPTSAMSLLQSLLISEYPGHEVVILGAKEDFGFLQEYYLPNTAVLAAEEASEFQGIADFAAAYPKKDEQTTVFVCEDFVCQQPTTDLEQALQEVLRKS